MPTFTADRLIPFAAALFRAAKVPSDEAELVARSLVDANLAVHGYPNTFVLSSSSFTTSRKLR